MNKGDNINDTNNGKFDLVIIGTGAAASQSWKVAIIDSRPFGGTCALRGCDPKKVLVAAEEAIDWNTRMKGKGISYDANNSTHIDWPELMKFKRTFTQPVPKNIKEAFLKTGIRPFHGVAQFIEKSKLRVIDNNTNDKKKLTIDAPTTSTPRQRKKNEEIKSLKENILLLLLAQNHGLSVLEKTNT